MNDQTKTESAFYWQTLARDTVRRPDEFGPGSGVPVEGPGRCTNFPDMMKTPRPLGGREVWP